MPMEATSAPGPIPKRQHRSARVKLTNQRIRDIEPSERIRRIPDSEAHGLMLQVLPSGTKSFTVRGRIGKGRSAPLVDITLGRVESLSLAEARDRARQIMAQLRQGQDPRQAEVSISVNELVAVYMERQQQRGVASADRIQGHLARVTRGLASRAASEVSHRTWADAVARIARSSGPSAANAARAHLKAMGRWARAEGLVALQVDALQAPAKTAAQRAADEKRSDARWTLRQSDWGRYWDACAGSNDPIFAAMLRYMALTGQRKGETASALWADIDQDRGIWTLPAANRKTGRGHVVYLGPLSLELLRGLPRLGELVFPGRGGRPVSGWTQRLGPVAAALGQRVQLHGLRRGYRTALTELGIGHDIAELMVGHHRTGLAAVYDLSELETERRHAQTLLEEAWRGVLA